MSRKNLLIILIIFPVTILNLSCEDPHPEVLEYLFFNDDLALLAEVGIGDTKGGKISVTNPSGGETFLDSDTILVEWTVNGDIGGNSVICGFSDNAGLEWSFTGSLDNNGSAQIILPDLYYDQTQCLIGIWSEDQQNSHYDVIDSYFNYDADSNYYEILYPNGGEALMMGEYAHIVFRSHGNVGTYLSNLNLYYSLFGGDSWYELDQDNYYSIGDLYFLVWNIPQLQSTNSNCMLKIEDRYTPNWYGVTNSTFTITNEEGIFYDMDFEETDNLSGWSLNGNWHISSEYSYSGSRSAICYGPEEATMSFTKTVETGGVITFYYRGEFYGYTNSDFRFSVDGVNVHTSYQDTYGIYYFVAYWVEPGQHTFSWTWDTSYPHSSSNYFISIDAISLP